MSNELMVVDSESSEVVGADIDQKVIELFLSLKKSDRTKEGYTASIKMLVAFVGCPLRDVTLTKAMAYKQWLTDKYASKHSIKLHINVAKSLYSFMVGINALPTNPFAAIPIDTPKEITHERILSEFEVQLMLHAKGVKQRDSLIVKVLYVAGLRASELCNLVWGDLNSNCVLHIQSGKGDKERWITLPSELCKQLLDFRGDSANDSPMFGSQKGGHLDESALHRIIKTVAAKAGVNGDVSAHWLRHSHASHSIDRGAELVTLRDTLGHASIATTNKYLHSKPGKSSALSLQF
jgi:integrase/recombinase XerD